ncbi:MAG: 50S ribosomal protein L11 methyltransferase [Deltaproteobacteria bacterium]|nr:50S ribosomal protein L11 methyltransferase [Deltaproteobacteria bacterium]MBW2120450.1 50S ribosomal protein L11 methyltransferase [Deltaproteobacteria bacterium]
MVPYDKLYIYEVDGPIDQDEAAFPPDYIGAWWEGDHSFLFFSRARDEAVQSILMARPALHLIDRFTLDYLDWQAGDEIRPFRVGKILFVPPWEEASPAPDEIPVLLDPSVVFGTGLHPTTRDCLEAIRRIYEQARPRTVIDLGTGTGILALACAKLGAQRVLAVDHNPLAVKTARRNVALNREEARIHVTRGKAEDFVRREGDLICCNLPHGVLDRLLDTGDFFHKEWSVLSGFFVSQGDGILRRLGKEGVDWEIISGHGPWRTVLGRRSAPARSGH